MGALEERALDGARTARTLEGLALERRALEGLAQERRALEGTLDSKSSLRILPVFRGALVRRPFQDGTQRSLPLGWTLGLE